LLPLEHGDRDQQEHREVDREANVGIDDVHLCLSSLLNTWFLPQFRGLAL
jgi:hypothetical protein